MLDGMELLARYVQLLTARRAYTKALYQGRFFGSCGPMTGNFDGFSNDYKTFLRRYWEAQVTAAEAVQGWVYWTWKVRQARGLAEVKVLNLAPG